MKKSLIIIAIIMFISATTYGQSITVISPAAGERWITGGTLNITWTKTGSMNGFVKIRLFNSAGARVLAITDRTENNGLFRNWIIPETVSTGDYTIRVKTVDDEVSDDSGLFRITKPDPRTRYTGDDDPPPDEDPRTPLIPENIIKIKSPDKSTIWRAGENVSIIWDKESSTAARVKITLLSRNNLMSSVTISPETENNGKFKLTIPDIVNGGKYIVKINEIGGIGNYGISEIFIIKGTTSKFEIK